MTGDLHNRPDAQVPLAQPPAANGGTPLAPESTRSPSEADERTGPWMASGAGRAPAPVPALIAGRYELGPEIAHGGMGAVYRATDRTFGRQVAVKLVREDLVGTELAARFAEEARITGQLQHPGIPSVHELGQLPDGRPFLAMKLFRGRTLAAELTARAEQLAADAAPEDLSVQRLDLQEQRALRESRRLSMDEELRRLARIFEQVCQAVAYAHSQGVIHRDLKPSNIMVAAFGEIQVMDWGLAKRLRDPATVSSGPSAAPEGADVAPAGGGAAGQGDMTRPGAVMGTLAYMPPEQARGETEAIDARADVFALGAILCQILTGCPPYHASTIQELLQKAAAGDLSNAMALLKDYASYGDTLEARLAGVAIRCLAPDRSRRPAHAGEVAVAVTGALTRSAESHWQAELSQARTDVEMAYGKRARLSPGFKAVGMLVLLALIWFFGYAYRAATVPEVKWTAEKEKQLQDATAAVQKERQSRIDAENKERKSRQDSDKRKEK
jgi:serine/threonine protein kinase